MLLGWRSARATYGPLFASSPPLPLAIQVSFYGLGNLRSRENEVQRPAGGRGNLKSFSPPAEAEALPAHTIKT